MNERMDCLDCRGADPQCAPEHDARAALGDEHAALHRVFLAAHRLTLEGKRLDGPAREEALAEMESAVLAAQDALPYHLKGPAIGARP